MERLSAFAWLPIPLFCGLLALSWVADFPPVAEPNLLRPILNFLFGTAVAVWVAWLAAKSFIQNASVSILLFGCGLLLFGVSNFIANLTFTYFNYFNLGVTIYTIGICLSGGIHLIVASAAWSAGNQSVRNPRLILIGAYGGILLIVAGYTQLAAANLTPLFFTMTEGSSLIRRVLLLLGVLLFAVAALLIGVIARRGNWIFGSWYSMALALMAIGLFGASFAPGSDSVTEWIGRSAQYFGGVYLVAAAFTARRNTREWAPLAHSALRESKERFRALAEASFEGIVTCQNGIIADANEQLAQMLGYDLAELMGKPMGELIPPDHKEEVTEKMLRGLEKNMEHPMVRKDGTILLVESHGRTLAGQDQSMRFLAIRDITTRKQQEQAVQESETQLRELFENMSEGFGVGEPIYDVHGVACDLLFTRVNKAFEQQTGITRDVVGMPLGTLLPHLERQWIETNARVALTGQPVRFDQFNRDTNRHYEVVSFSPGKGRFAILFNDVTEQKKAEKTLKQSRDDLELRVQERTEELQQRANQLARLASELTVTEDRERQRLARFLHDNLQQLLVGAKFSLHRLAKRVPEAQRSEFGRVENLLNESISASRSLTMELSPPILHEAGLTAGLEWLARWMKETHDLTVDLTIDENLKIDREDMRLLLFQTVRELLFNVTKHARTDRAKLIVSRRDDLRIQAVVEDHGVGFDEKTVIANRDRIAKGFGLFSIRERLDLLGGSLDIESSPGRGARFTVTAPFQSATEPAPDPRVAALSFDQTLQLPPPADSRPGKIRLLLVDDHAVVRQGISMLLNSEKDVEIVGEAADGTVAVSLARALHPDVILMDFSMPRMDGIEATRAIHNELPRTQVIGLSMYDEADRAKAMLEAGAVSYLSKTCKSDTLIATIRQVAKISRSI